MSNDKTDKLIEMARESGFMQHLGVIAVPSIKHLENFYEMAFIEGMQEQARRSVDRAVNAQADEAFKTRLAAAIEEMPFGDTAASFAQFVREFK